MRDPVQPSRHRGRDLLFYTGLAFLLCHELDAVAQHEWRLLPLLSGLSDERAYPLFVWLHVPLFALPLWWLASPDPLVRRRAQLVVDAFMVVHAGLHLALRHHDLYTFHSTLSQTCILAAGALALIHATWLFRGDTHPL